MTPSEVRFWHRVQRRASLASPEIAAVILRAFTILRDQMGEAAFVRVIETRDVDALIRAVLSPRVLDLAFAPVRERLYRTTSTALPYFVRELPAAGKINGEIAVHFNVLNPKVLDAIRALDTRVVARLQDEVRATVRQVVERELAAGTHPRAMARSLRGAIGLAPNQEAAVANFRAALEAGDFAKARTYTLRDRRFDPRLRSGNVLTADQIDRMVEVYRQRFVGWNAEVNARTAALDANKLAQHLAWEGAIARGIVDGDTLTKTWSGVLDTRERPEHVAMEGETVAFDAPFSNGEMLPGDSTYGCRCLPRYSTGYQVAANPAVAARLADRQAEAAARQSRKAARKAKVAA